MTSDLPPIASPCTGVCMIASETGLCTGCLRTAVEIAVWRDAGSPQRLAILQRLKERGRVGVGAAAGDRPRSV